MAAVGCAAAPARDDASFAHSLAGYDAYGVRPAEQPGAFEPGDEGRLARALGSPDVHVRRGAAFVSGLRPFADPALALALAHAERRDRDPTVRAYALHALARAGAPGARALVLAALDDPVPALRAQGACEVRFALDDAGFARALALLQHDPSVAVRICAASAVAAGSHGRPGARSALAAARNDPDPSVRAAARAELARLTAR